MKKAILTMGLPGSGKSTMMAQEYDLSEYALIDPDEIKKEQADYSDERPEVYHEWSKAEAKVRISQAIRDGKNIIIDGTGTNAEKMVRQINELHGAGYHVEIFYVKVSVATCLKRNKERPRSVPESIIYEKAGLISTSLEIVSGYADRVKTIRND